MHRRFLVALGVSMVAACTSTEAPVDPNAAMLVSIAARGAIWQKGDVCVRMIDQKPAVSFGLCRQGPIALSPGPHVVEALYEFAGKRATLSLSADFRQGGRYALRADTQGPCAALLWLEDQATGELVTEKNVVPFRPAMNIDRVVFALTCG